MRRPTSAPGDSVLTVACSATLVGALLLLLVACGQATSTEQPTDTAQPSSTPPSPAETPTTEPSTESPTENPTASASLEPATPEPATPPPAATPGSGTGSAASCSGSDENRDFFASMAAAVDWAVYCPVLADGWFVDDGRYRLAGGGGSDQLRRPGTAGSSQQGLRSTGDGCARGRDVGAVDFGDRTGSLIAGDDGPGQSSSIGAPIRAGSS
jgi:hypothetical protein